MEISDIWNMRFATPSWQPHRILPPNNRFVGKAPEDTCVWCGETVKDVGQNNRILWSTDNEGTSCRASAGSCNANGDDEPWDHFRSYFWKPFYPPNGLPYTQLPFEDFHSADEAEYIANQMPFPDAPEKAMEAYNDPARRGQCVVGKHQTFTQLNKLADDANNSEKTAMFDLNYNSETNRYLHNEHAAFDSHRGLGAWKHILDLHSEDSSCSDKSCGDDECHTCFPEKNCGDHVSCVKSTICPECNEQMANMEVEWKDIEGNGLVARHAVPPSTKAQGDLDWQLGNGWQSLFDYLHTQAPPTDHLAEEDREAGLGGNSVHDWYDIESPICINKNCANFKKDADGQIDEYAVPWFEARYEV